LEKPCGFMYHEGSMNKMGLAYEYLTYIMVNRGMVNAHTCKSCCCKL